MTEIDRLAAIEAIRSLQSRYVRLADAKDWQKLSELFVSQGSFTVFGVDGKPFAAMVGREQIRHTISAGVGAGTAVHHLFSYEIEIQHETRARAIWSMEDWVDRTDDRNRTADAPFATLHGTGHYHVTYEKVDGEWFIADQKLHRTTLKLTH